MTHEEARQIAQQTIKLSQCKNMMRIIAEAQIRIHGEYFCDYDGVLTRVVAD